MLSLAFHPFPITPHRSGLGRARMELHHPGIHPIPPRNGAEHGGNAAKPSRTSSQLAPMQKVEQGTGDRFAFKPPCTPPIYKVSEGRSASYTKTNRHRGKHILSSANGSNISMTRIATAVMLLILLVFGAGNIWLYIEGTDAIEKQFQSQAEWDARAPETDQSKVVLLQHLEGWAQKATLSTGMTGAGLVLVVGLGLVLWRRAHMRRFAATAAQLDELSRQLDRAKLNAGRYKSERTTVEEELRRTYDQMEGQIQERTETLNRKCEQLEKELNSRLRAEKALTYQAKELERSKDVLELHVQARTQELQKLKSRYELILNSAGEGIYGLDLQGRTTFVNPAAAKLTGREIEEMIGRTEVELFCGDASGDGSARLALDEESRHLGEQVFGRKDGGQFPVEYVRTPLSEDGRLFGAVVIFKDITERKQTEETISRKAAELARSNAELEQFAYVASHDLQEPLRKIQAFGDRLKSKCDAVDLKDGRDYLDRMLRAASRMQTLINDLLTFSRVISTNQPFMPVNLAEVTREVLGDLEVRIEQTKAKVELGDLPTVDGDPTQMRQLLQNLISNALKFNKPDQPPVVKVSATVQKVPFSAVEGAPEAEECVLKVEDNGIGFEDRYMDKIFAVFQRLHGRSEYEGTGVGLAVCRRITDRHGGTIQAQSKPGEGATFMVTLPVRQSADRLKPMPAAA